MTGFPIATNQSFNHLSPDAHGGIRNPTGPAGAIADLLEATAPVASQRVRRLLDAKELAHAAYVRTRETMDDLRYKHLQLDVRLDRFRQDRIAADDPSTVATQAERERVVAELARLEAIRVAQEATWQFCGQLVLKIENNFAEVVQGRTVADIEAKPTFKGTILDAIEARRRRRREHEADLHRLNSSAVPKAVAVARMKAQINSLAERGEPVVSRLIEDRNGAVMFPDRGSLAFSRSGGLLPLEQADPLALNFWLHKDAIIARLEAQIDKESDDAHALTDKQLAEQIATVERDRLATEIELSALIWQARGQGLPAQHDPELDVSALLGISVTSTIVERVVDAIGCWSQDVPAEYRGGTRILT